MSPALRLKPKDQKARGKHFKKPSSHGNTTTTGVAPASGYNPLSGTFHTFETVTTPLAIPINGNDHFQNIDDGDDHASGIGADYDSVSINGSWSGESEDHKEKPSHSMPGIDHNRREKIRQKNERKHQRQKERRAKELHEQCRKVLMSRKLESLAEQLVAMGFPHKQATVALIQNEGRLEESVVWLLECPEEHRHREPNLENPAKLKIDVVEELDQIRDMEIRHKASKQEVQRIVVSCEGDLEKAEEMFKLQKVGPPSVPSKSDEMGDPPSAQPQNPTTAVALSSIIQQENGKKVSVVGSDTRAKITHVLQRKVPKSSDVMRPQTITVPAGKKWVAAGSDVSPSVLMASSIQSSLPIPTENCLMGLQLGSLKPVGKLVPSMRLSSSSPGMVTGQYVNSLETVIPSRVVPPVPVSGSLTRSILDPNPLYNELYRPQFLSTNGAKDDYYARIARGNGLFSREGVSLSPTFAASSLGLFSGQSFRSLSPTGWNPVSGSTIQLDYTKVDWSMDHGLLSSSRPAGLWTSNGHAYDSSLRYDPNQISGSGLRGGWSSSLEEKEVFDTPRWFDSLPPY